MLEPNNLSQLEVAKRTLFDADALDVANVKVFPGNNRDATPDDIAQQINNAIGQLLSGDYDKIEDGWDEGA